MNNINPIEKKTIHEKPILNIEIPPQDIQRERVIVCPQKSNEFAHILEVLAVKEKPNKRKAPKISLKITKGKIQDDWLRLMIMYVQRAIP